jgi:hypothetical protein
MASIDAQERQLGDWIETVRNTRAAIVSAPHQRKPEGSEK